MRPILSVAVMVVALVGYGSALFVAFVDGLGIGVFSSYEALRIHAVAPYVVFAGLVTTILSVLMASWCFSRRTASNGWLFMSLLLAMYAPIVSLFGIPWIW